MAANYIMSHRFNGPSKELSYVELRVPGTSPGDVTRVTVDIFDSPECCGCGKTLANADDVDIVYHPTAKFLSGRHVVQALTCKECGSRYDLEFIQ